MSEFNASGATGPAVEIRAGSCWRYRAPEGFEASRLVVGAVLAFAGQETIVCCAVTGAPRRRPDGSVDEVTIPFLPLSAGAFLRSVVTRDGEGSVPEGFMPAFEDWQSDPRGLSAFTVPFEGLLDRMIALQMAEIAGQPAP